MSLLRNRIPFSCLMLLVALTPSYSQAQNLDEANQKLVEWIKKYNAFGPDHAISSDMASAIAERIAAGESNIRMTIGPGLIGAKQPFLLQTYADQFFAFPLSAEDATALGVEQTNVGFVSNKKQDTKKTPIIKFSDLKIENADALPGTSEIKGSVGTEQLGDLSGKYAVRLSYSANNNVSNFFWLEQPLPEGKGTLDFHFGPVNKDVAPAEAYKGPLPIFIDLVTVEEKDGQIIIDVYSNTVAKMLHIVP